MKLTDKLKILFGRYPLPDNFSELLEVQKRYEELMEKHMDAEARIHDDWIKYCDWAEEVTQRYRGLTDFLLKANALLAEELNQMCEVFRKITADDSFHDK